MNASLTERLAELQAALEATSQAAALLEMAKAAKLGRNSEQRFNAWVKLSEHAVAQAQRLKAPAPVKAARSHKAKPVVASDPEPNVVAS